MVKKKRQSDALEDGSSTDSSDGQMLSPSATGVCQHAKKSVDTTKLRKVLKTNGLVAECMQCAKQGATSPAAEVKESSMDESICGFEYDNTLWLCLKCGSQLCGRARNQHALQHYKTPHSDSHSLTMNTRSYEIWCYDCDNEVKSNSRKNLLECVEMVKKTAQKPPPVASPAANTQLNNIEGKLLATWESSRPLVETKSGELSNKPIPLPPPPPPPIPGMAKRITDPAIISAPILNIKKPQNNFDPKEIELLPRVRGLTNLGNTCFFNAVMQCLAQTPYLLDVLKELSEPGEEFILPGGTFKFKDDEDVHLPMIKGTLSSWGGLTAALAQALEELQSGGGVFTPSKLFDKLCTKCPQFRGGDQHDSHELLRHLLESVRSEDLKRYQRVILTNLGYKDQDINSVSEEMRQKCKIYGNQAADRILRPEQVFRGFLVSTLTCQDCFNVSSRHEYFLDMSLPVSVEKPQPPIRRKTSPENTPNTCSFFLNAPPAGPSKAQLNKEKEKKRKAKRAAKHHETKLRQKALYENATDGAADANATAANTEIGCANREDAAGYSSSTSSSEQSDADVEDNLLDDNAVTKSTRSLNATTYDTNGNNQLPHTGKAEKRDESPEHMDKDSLDEDEHDSGIANSPANAGSNFLSCSETNGGSDGNSVTANNSLLAVGLSEKGATMMRQLSITESAASVEGVYMNGELKDEAAITAQLEQLKLSEQKAARMKAKRVRTQSHSDWSTTIAPRYQCEDGECSVQSCLNNFTGVELMTGNNKVGCENCTKRINGTDPKAKTVNTNATKQFLISSPPAVLILHLKRFQLGPRCIFRKLTRGVSFPMVLDIAPFCGSKVKNLPNIDRKQKKLLYALYGIVEHSGGMYGGHYTAYVKVRTKLSRDDKRWNFLPQGSKAELDQDDEQRKKLEELLAKEKARELRMKAANDSDDFSNSDDCSSTTTTTSTSDADELPTDGDAAAAGGAYGGDEEARDVQVPMGKWYYVSDSRVQEVNEETVLKAQAYLLFYERIY
ncbi:ubiquitin carboxyl-terminal hydrolase 45 [Ceratitis capitata]|uniref:ubiquitinyl hydrolase 1 n=1 Tax=Ceratitis capitata TaxID=7213 RepID=W8BJS3_CERCA|nr:ubiquitin carboxyl-terminal hydrolase 45 [Ceratitis capitata]XP_020714329.1 ubiquitin carboxyl-terminal hydrolase 45 [Ceratitis capitata]